LRKFLRVTSTGLAFFYLPVPEAPLFEGKPNIFSEIGRKEK
jgi:hypothetical protein